MSPARWLIVGGGIHGVHIAARLLGGGYVKPERLRILDPAPRLLSRWLECTSITGMTHLRSPAVHHVDLDPWSLGRFAGRRRRWKRGVFASPYDRPSVQLFAAHCEHVIAKYGLAEIHVRGYAQGISLKGSGAFVKTATGVHEAEILVLAMGASERPEWPTWARPEDPRMTHLFARGAMLPEPGSGERAAVVGGGISAAQVALKLAAAGQPVQLITRHPLRQHQFDSDPGWLGPKFMSRFAREPDVVRRRAIISRARHRGSVPPDVWHKLRHAVRVGALVHHQAEILDVPEGPGPLSLHLSNATVVNADRLVLATGFSTRRPGGQLLDSLIAAERLPVAACGYPIVDASLRWHPRVHVSGPLAELELGPAARNIAGARRAADRIARRAAASLETPNLSEGAATVSRRNHVVYPQA